MTAGGKEGLCAGSLPLNVGRTLFLFCSGDSKEWEAELNCCCYVVTGNVKGSRDARSWELTGKRYCWDHCVESGVQNIWKVNAFSRTKKYHESGRHSSWGWAADCLFSIDEDLALILGTTKKPNFSWDWPLRHFWVRLFYGSTSGAHCVRGSLPGEGRQWRLHLNDACVRGSEQQKAQASS